jgi:hypothetical protein
VIRRVNSRLERLEEKLVPQIDLASQRELDIARERRRRRLEANGEVDRPLDWASLGFPPGRRFLDFETAFYGRQLVWKRNREREEEEERVRASLEQRRANRPVGGDPR